MELEVVPATPAYTNRSAVHARAAARLRVARPARTHASERAVDRMLTVLRAYEQRAQRRAALHAWLVARRTAAR